MLRQAAPPPTADAASPAGLVMGEQPEDGAVAARATLQRRDTLHSYISADAAQVGPGAATAFTAAAAAAPASPALCRLCLERTGTLWPR